MFLKSSIGQFLPADYVYPQMPLSLTQLDTLRACHSRSQHLIPHVPSDAEIDAMLDSLNDDEEIRTSASSEPYVDTPPNLDREVLSEALPAMAEEAPAPEPIPLIAGAKVVLDKIRVAAKLTTPPPAANDVASLQPSVENEVVPELSPVKDGKARQEALLSHVYPSLPLDLTDLTHDGLVRQLIAVAEQYRKGKSYTTVREEYLYLSMALNQLGLFAPACQRRFKTDTLFAENADLNLIHPHYICMPAMRPERRPA